MLRILNLFPCRNMHWIGIGFLIAIGFGLAIVAVPLVIGLLTMAWELKEVVAVIAGIIIVVILSIAYPDQVIPVLFWGFVGLMVFGFYSEKRKKAHSAAQKK